MDKVFTDTRLHFIFYLFIFKRDAKMPETSLMFIVSEMQGKRTDDLLIFFPHKTD